MIINSTEGRSSAGGGGDDEEEGLGSSYAAAVVVPIISTIELTRGSRQNRSLV